jgi:hypothetical protein
LFNNHLLTEFSIVMDDANEATTALGIKSDSC